MPQRPYTLSDFDFDLPTELLAEYPAEKRDHSKLMVVNLSDRSIEHKNFYDLPDYLEPEDCLVLNDTKVIPARMIARKETMKGALLQVLLVEATSAYCPAWTMLVDPIKKVRLGTRIIFGDNQLVGVIDKYISEKEVTIIFPDEKDSLVVREQLFALGKTPLPPYIRRELRAEDKTRYQTVFAKNDGALAAPTAGLHFTPDLLKTISEKGVDTTSLTLTIGMGTFNPIYQEDLNLFKIHKESFNIPEATAIRINQANRESKRVLAVGTTSLRAIESATCADGTVKIGKAETEIFIRPPHIFKSNLSLLTNFHTPQSSLIMLISAFMGYEFTREVYQAAIEEKYRFFSYGDAMLILR